MRLFVKSRTLGLAALAGLPMSGTAMAAGKLKIGVTATPEGAYTILGVDGTGGFNTAVK